MENRRWHHCLHAPFTWAHLVLFSISPNLHAYVAEQTDCYPKNEDIKCVKIVGDLYAPTSFTFLRKDVKSNAPEHDILIATKEGKIYLARQITKGAWNNVAEEVTFKSGQQPNVFSRKNKLQLANQGLHDIAIHPNYGKIIGRGQINRTVYFAYDTRVERDKKGSDPQQRLELASASLTEDHQSFVDFKVLFRTDAVRAPGEFGEALPAGKIAFQKNVPTKDRVEYTLLLSVGDDRRDPTELVSMDERNQSNADRKKMGFEVLKKSLVQDLNSHLGKILRLNLDGTIPHDNPISINGTRSAIFSLGHRDVKGIAIHPQTQTIWAVEHGPQGGDELNRIEGGRNYGYPVVSSGLAYEEKDRKYWVQGCKDNPLLKEYAQPMHVWGAYKEEDCNNNRYIEGYSIAPSGIAQNLCNRYPTWSESDILVGSMTRSSNENSPSGKKDQLGNSDIKNVGINNGGIWRMRILGRGQSIKIEAVEILGIQKEKADGKFRVRDVRFGPDNFLYAIRHHVEDIRFKTGELIRLEPTKPLPNPKHCTG